MRGRQWTTEDDACLRRSSMAGMTDGQIAELMGRDRAFICRKRQAKGVERGLSPAMQAVLARLSLRRLQSRAAA
jgi:hypothetical protein